jgi:hypothetical protein
MRQLTNIFRRVYRIFAHAWYSHREVFWNVEGRTGLYIFYKTVCDVYGLVPEDNYTIPSEAEGIDPVTESKSSAPPVIMKREPSDSASQTADKSLAEAMSDHTLSTAGTTKRHRNSPSVSAMSVQTVPEENEEEEERPALQPRPVTQIFDSNAEDTSYDSDEVTVIEYPNQADDSDSDSDSEEDDEEEEEEDGDDDESAEPEAADAVDETEKQGASEGQAASEAQEEEKQNEDTTTQTAAPEAAETDDSAVKAAEKGASDGKAKVTEKGDKTSDKTDAAELEQADKSESASDAPLKTQDGTSESKANDD